MKAEVQRLPETNPNLLALPRCCEKRKAGFWKSTVRTLESRIIRITSFLTAVLRTLI